MQKLFSLRFYLYTLNSLHKSLTSNQKSTKHSCDCTKCRCSKTYGLWDFDSYNI